MQRLVPSPAVWWIRLLNKTVRYRVVGREHFERALSSGRPVVGAFLHGHLFMLMAFISRPGSGRWLSMASSSRDGNVVAEIERRLGFEVIRGSSGNEGLQAILDMIRRVKQGNQLNACLAVDGSRGPAGIVQMGVLSLAQHTDGLLLPVAAAARPAKHFSKSWDRAVFPLPFSRVDIVFGEPQEVPRRLPAAQVEDLRLALEKRLDVLQSLANERSSRATSARHAHSPV